MLPDPFTNIISPIRQSQANAIRAVNTELINLYWQVGEYISREAAGSTRGEKTVDELAEYISKQHPDIKGSNRRDLYRMKLVTSFINHFKMQVVGRNRKLNEIFASAVHPDSR